LVHLVERRNKVNETNQINFPGFLPSHTRLSDIEERRKIGIPGPFEEIT
jgi:hypothetical protein